VRNLTLLDGDGQLLATVGGYAPPHEFVIALDRLRSKVSLPPID
jgi:hypothetical protein